jgi:hypothetical protein
LREASCSCGQLRLIVDGDPIRVTICHCLACQQRTGSAFSLNARFDAGAVRVEGRHSEYVRLSDEGEERWSRFCPECGSTVYFGNPYDPDMVAVPVGCFADPSFPAPAFSVWEERRHGWVVVPDGAERIA